MATPDTAPQPTTTDASDGVIHIVSYWRDLIPRLLGRIPRALCGELLTGDQDRAEPGANAPVCPACERLDR